MMNRKNNLLFAILLSSVSLTSFSASYTYRNNMKIDLANDTADIIEKNNKPILKINKKNDYEVSHITFNEFNVGKSGLKIDNRIGSEHIISEVIGKTESILLGNIRILGKNADVTVANPNGIVCIACKFTNANTLTLFAGRAEYNIDLYFRQYNYLTGNGSTITIKNTKSTFSDLNLIAQNIDIYNSDITAKNITMQHIANINDSNSINGKFSISSDSKLKSDSLVARQEYSKFTNNGIITGNTSLNLTHSSFKNNGKMSGSALTADLDGNIYISGKNKMEFEKWEINDLNNLPNKGISNLMPYTITIK